MNDAAATPSDQLRAEALRRLAVGLDVPGDILETPTDQHIHSLIGTANRVMNTRPTPATSTPEPRTVYCDEGSHEHEYDGTYVGGWNAYQTDAAGSLFLCPTVECTGTVRITR